MTYADVLRPSLRKQALVYDMTVVLGGSLFIALVSQVKIPLHFTPVPITGQTFGVLLIGAMLGPIRGAMSVLAYIGQGIAGLPVFAGGASGIGYFLGPTGGYLLGFIAGAYTTGLLGEKEWDRKIGTTVLAMLIGNVAIFAVGLPWLAVFVGVDRVVAVGLLPFIPGDIIKIGLAAALLPSGWKIFGKISKR